MWKVTSIEGHLHINNITSVVDRNKLQIDRYTEGINSMENFQNVLDFALLT